MLGGRDAGLVGGNDIQSQYEGAMNVIDAIECVEPVGWASRAGEFDTVSGNSRGVLKEWKWLVGPGAKREMYLAIAVGVAGAWIDLFVVALAQMEIVSEGTAFEFEKNGRTNRATPGYAKRITHGKDRVVECSEKGDEKKSKQL